MVTETVNIIVTTRGARVAQTRIRGIGRSSRLAKTAVLGLGAALVALGTGVAIRGLLRLSDSSTEVGNRIRTVTSSTEVFLSVQERLFDVANRTGGSIEDTARLFQRLKVGTRDLGVGTARVVNVVEGLNAALVVSGSTAREASAALLQLGQGLASDNLSGEELRSLRENLPQLAQELADVLGKPIGALKEMGRQGLLNAELVFPALEKAVVKFQEKLENGEVIFTFAQAFNAVRNGVVKAFAIIQRSTPLTQDMTKAIFSLSEGLGERLVKALAAGIRFLIPMVNNFTLVKNVIGNVSTGVRLLVDLLLSLKDVGIILIDFLVAPFALANDALQQLGLDATRLGRFFGFSGGIFSDEALALSKANAREATEFTKELIADVAKRSAAIGKRLGIGIEEGAQALTPVQEKFEAFAKAIEDSANNPPKLADDPDTDPRPKEAVIDEDAIKAQEALLKLIRQRQLAELKVINPRLEQIAILDDEINVIEDLILAGAERGLAEREINALLRDRAELLAMTDFGQGLATSITDSFSQAFAASIKSGANFVDTLADNLEKAAQNSLIEGFEEAFKEMQKGLGEVFDKVGKELGESLGPTLGPVLGKALSGAIQFALLQGLSALLGGGGNSQSSSNGNVQSAVTSTQAVRGIVAGPTEIAIANVGRNIAEAIDPLLQETVVQTGVLRGILASVQAGTAASGGAATGDTEALAFGSAPAATA